MNVELDEGLGGLAEAVVGRADVVSGVVAGHGRVGEGGAADEVLAGGHLAVAAVPGDLGLRVAAGDAALEGGGVAGLGHDQGVGGHGDDLGADWKKMEMRLMNS